ncbi:MAG: ClpX C4-type zinc finger protein [Pseudomonas sp.]
MDEIRKRTRRPKKSPPVLHCSFCEKSQNQVDKLIAKDGGMGTDAITICDECIDMCVEIINEQFLIEAGNSPKAISAYIVRQNEIIGHARERVGRALDILNHSMPPASDSQH